MTSHRARWLAFFGALLCALAVAGGAWASHGLDGMEQVRAAVGALMAFGHGLALQCLAHRSTESRAHVAGSILLLLGTLLFCGALIVSLLWSARPVLAPLGGMLTIVGWLALAIDALTRPR